MVKLQASSAPSLAPSDRRASANAARSHRDVLEPGARRSAVLVRGLRKTYGAVVAVADVSLDVTGGTIFGVIGPNGAGKTTLLECIEGLTSPDSGVVRVLDLDPAADGQALRERIGIQLQNSALPDRLRVGEALALFRSFYRSAIPTEVLIRDVGLTESVRVPYANLSGGQKQRLFIALALLNDPELVFLDELTTGLDPQARRAVWDLIRDIAARGRTVVMTTHSMEEAAELCDRVAIIEGGRILANDRPDELVRRLGAEHRVSFVCPTFDPAVLRAVPSATRGEVLNDHVVIHGRSPDLIAEVVAALNAAGLRFRDLQLTQPSLEDVFLSLTGRELRE
jgi:ABC-2 type transport system ATP-binding protein